jgi:hypothetical protein
VPIVGGISDGQRSMRAAVPQALPDVPHQLCHFHSLREAAKPLYAAARQAKQALQKALRGVRPIARQGEGRNEAAANVRRAYCPAGRRARPEAGRPPLDAAGLTLHTRLTAIADSLERLANKGRSPRHCGA